MDELACRSGSDPFRAPVCLRFGVVFRSWNLADRAFLRIEHFYGSSIVNCLQLANPEASRFTEPNACLNLGGRGSLAQAVRWLERRID